MLLPVWQYCHQQAFETRQKKGAVHKPLSSKNHSALKSVHAARNRTAALCISAGSGSHSPELKPIHCTSFWLSMALTLPIHLGRTAHLSKISSRCDSHVEQRCQDSDATQDASESLRLSKFRALRASECCLCIRILRVAQFSTFESTTSIHQASAAKESFRSLLW